MITHKELAANLRGRTRIGNSSAKGAKYNSPGQRPGLEDTSIIEALKARNKSHDKWPWQDYFAPSAL